MVAGLSLLSEMSEQVRPMILEKFFNEPHGNVAQVLCTMTNEDNGMFCSLLLFKNRFERIAAKTRILEW